jgi:hypothetical protein
VVDGTRTCLISRSGGDESLGSVRQGPEAVPFARTGAPWGVIGACGKTDQVHIGD